MNSRKLGRLYSVFVSRFLSWLQREKYFVNAAIAQRRSLKPYLLHSNHLKASSLLFNRLKYVRWSSAVSEKPFFVPNLSYTHVWNKNKRQIFKVIFKIIFFHIATNNPLYLACEKAITIKASIRVTSPVNKFEASSNTTRGRRNAVPQCW